MPIDPFALARRFIDVPSTTEKEFATAELLECESRAARFRDAAPRRQRDALRSARAGGRSPEYVVVGEPTQSTFARASKGTLMFVIRFEGIEDRERDRCAGRRHHRRAVRRSGTDRRIGCTRSSPRPTARSMSCSSRTDRPWNQAQNCCTSHDHACLAPDLIRPYAVGGCGGLARVLPALW